MGELKKWRDEKWVRIGTDGSIKGACGTSKNKKNPDRCLPLAKARSMSKAERAKTARKKKRAGARGKTVVANTRAGRVTKRYTKKMIRSEQWYVDQYNRNRLPQDWVKDYKEFTNVMNALKKEYGE